MASVENLQLLGTGYVASIATIVVPGGKVLSVERLSLGTAGQYHSQELTFNGSLTVRPLIMPVDAWCGAGFVSPEPSGRIVNLGGWSSSELLQSMEYLPCTDADAWGTCQWVSLSAFRVLEAARWYATALPLPDGGVAIIGGSRCGSCLDSDSAVSTMERVPGGVPFGTELLEEVKPSFYPTAHVLPDGKVFLLSGSTSVLVNVSDGTTLARLPSLAGYRTFPATGGSVLLPLNAHDGYASTVLVCGGGQSGSSTDTSAPALASCGTIRPLVPSPVWTVFEMPSPRLLPDLILLLDGTVFLTNGAKAGYAGFLGAGIGASVPNNVSYIYDPATNTFTEAATSPIARMYHSTAVLLADGSVLISGSTGQADASLPPSPGLFPDEKRIERYAPAYLQGARPVVSSLDSRTWAYNDTYSAVLADSADDVRVVLFTNGYVTHSQHMGQRMLVLSSSMNGSRASFLSPPTAALAPPGWYMLFFMVGGTPSLAQWIQVGGDPASIATWPTFPQAPYATPAGPPEVPYWMVSGSIAYLCVTVVVIAALLGVIFARKKRWR